MFLQPFGDGHKRPDEHAGVPAILTAVQILQRFVQVRFFDELLRAMEGRLVGPDALRRRQRFAYANVTVTRSRLSWLDANGDDRLAAASQVEPIREDLLKFFLVADDVV